MNRAKQDIDAGAGHRSVEQDEPHRPHDMADRGGTYVRESEQAKPQPRRYSREEIERNTAAPPDPDDPARS